MTEQTIENWMDFNEAYIFNNAKIYNPKHFCTEVLIGVIEYFDFLLDDCEKKKTKDFDHIILNKVLLYIAEEMKELDIYDAQSILVNKVELRIRFQAYLKQCKTELISRYDFVFFR